MQWWLLTCWGLRSSGSCCLASKKQARTPCPGACLFLQQRKWGRACLTQRAQPPRAQRCPPLPPAQLPFLQMAGRCTTGLCWCTTDACSVKPLAQHQSPCHGCLKQSLGPRRFNHEHALLATMFISLSLLDTSVFLAEHRRQNTFEGV